MNNFPRRLLILKGGIGKIANAITWLLNADFSDTQAAPIPRTCEPGPGALTVVQIEGAQSISGGKLVLSDAVTSWGSRGGYEATARARTAGRMVRVGVLLATNNQKLVFGFAKSAGASHANLSGGIFFSQGGPIAVRAANVVAPGSFSAATDYTLYEVLRAAGSMIFIKGGVFGASPVLYWVDGIDTTASPLGPMYGTGDASSGTISLDNLHYFNLPAPFSSDYGLATLHQVNPVAETEYEGEADGIFDFTFTLPAGWSGTDQIEMDYRYVDATHKWSAIATGTGYFYLGSQDGGSGVDRISVSGVFTAGQTYTIRVIAQGTKHNAYTLSGTTWTKRGGEVDVATSMDSEKTIRAAVILGTGTTFSALDAWPRTLSAALAAELDRVDDVTWLLRDDFNTDAAAGQIVRRPAVPGPGTLTYIQASANFSIADGDLVTGSSITTEINHGFYHDTAYARIAGMAILSDFKRLSAGGVYFPHIGWRIGVGLFGGAGENTVSVESGTDWLYKRSVKIGASAQNDDYKIALILCSNGCLMAIKGGAYTNWTILFPKTGDGTTTPLYASVNLFSNLTLFRNFRVRQLPAPFNTDYGLATWTTTTFTQSLGAELLTNGDFSAWTADNPDGWGVTESAPNRIVTQVAPDGSAGTGAARFYSDAPNWSPEISQDVLGAAGNLSECSIIVSARTTGKGYFGEQYALVNGFTGVGTFRVPVRRKDVSLFRIQVTADAAADFVVNSASVKRITPNATQTATADGIFDFEFTVPASPAIYDQIHLLYRIEVAGDEFYDCWDAYLIRAADATWSFALDSISAGTRTNRISVTGITGSPDTIRVICEGSLHDCYTKTGTTWTKRGSQVNVSHLNTSTLINTVYSSAATPVRLTPWPRTLPAAQAAELERV